MSFRRPGGKGFMKGLVSEDRRQSLSAVKTTLVWSFGRKLRNTQSCLAPASASQGPREASPFVKEKSW